MQQNACKNIWKMDAPYWQSFSYLKQFYSMKFIETKTKIFLLQHGIKFTENLELLKDICDYIFRWCIFCATGQSHAFAFLFLQVWIFQASKWCEGKNQHCQIIARQRRSWSHNQHRVSLLRGAPKWRPHNSSLALFPFQGWMRKDDHRVGQVWCKF